MSAYLRQARRSFTLRSPPNARRLAFAHEIRCILVFPALVAAKRYGVGPAHLQPYSRACLQLFAHVIGILNLLLWYNTAISFLRTVLGRRIVWGCLRSSTRPRQLEDLRWFKRHEQTTIVMRSSSSFVTSPTARPVIANAYEQMRPPIGSYGSAIFVFFIRSMHTSKLSKSSGLRKATQRVFLPWTKGRPMMTWNYRVFRENEHEYVIREVFYAEDGSILGCTALPAEPYGRSGR